MRPFHDSEQRGADEPRTTALSNVEAEYRMGLLAGLKTALQSRGVESVLARRQRLVLQYNLSPCSPSGLADPQLHVFTADGQRRGDHRWRLLSAGIGRFVPGR